ncbi:diguanylate cyclase (GGDEF)-like protein [Litorivivens lipolytica]|uniref:Diguanylate cyclase (GGDEF)-like protein n=1 Tax=Litorivivens lipolytica TaxID=1524264 RepID=A0A7W4W670_9GAMM|nr:bifunctional diguanylate cyclase/phosphodiesterase [Litorivivens lipolytica]MBB3048174.1 diguanylate cyclase (GGDEF)-like protein [Litorivivens lipolytica]
MISLLNAAAAVSIFAAIQALWLGHLSRNVRVFRAFAFICGFNAIFLLASAAWYNADSLAQSYSAAKWQTLGGLGNVGAFAWLIALISGQIRHRYVRTGLWVTSAVLAAIVLLTIATPAQSLLPGLELVGKKTYLLQNVFLIENPQSPMGAAINMLVLAIYGWCLTAMISTIRRGDRITTLCLLSYILIQIVSIIVRTAYDLGIGDSRFPTGVPLLWLLAIISICYGREHQLAVKRLESQSTRLRKEIDRRTQSETKLRKQAYFDELTGVPNELWLRDYLSKEFAGAAPCRVVMLAQIRDFRGIRLRFGNTNADQLLNTIAGHIKETLGPEDVIARVHDNTFCVVVSSINEAFFQQINNIDSGSYLNDNLIKPFFLGRQRVEISFNVGIIDACKEDTAENLLYRVEQALNEAVQLGRNRSVFYNDTLSAQLARDRRLEADFKTSLAYGEFELHFQPKVNPSGICLGAEALVRWKHHQEGIIPPIQFISLAERSGFMTDLGAWVIRDACRFLRRAQDRGLRLPDRLSINISPLQLADDNLKATLTDCLAEFALEASRIELELTESALVETTAANQELLESIRELGVSIAIDDFGTGYSSLSYLQNLPLDVLKIDKRFVDNMEEPQGEQLVRAIIQMGRALNMGTVAEGVETQRQMEALKRMGCDQFQGYLFSKPLPEDKFLQWLAAGKRLAAAN